MKFLIKKFEKEVKLNNPLLIEGLPGIGNVARIAVSYLINKLNAKPYLSIYSYISPNSVFVNEDATIELPKIDFYYYKNKKGRDLVLVSGDYQPGREDYSYLLAEKILDIAEELSVKEIITLGGFPVIGELNKVKVYGAITTKEYIKDFSKLGVIFDGSGVNLIIGAAGLLLGLGKLRGMKGISLLAETKTVPEYAGIKSSREILRILNDYLNLGLSLQDLDREIEKMESRRVERKKIRRRVGTEPRTEEARYIG